MATELRTIEQVRSVLENARTIAVLGAHPEDHRPASYVPAYLAGRGYRILPVNPRFEGQELFGSPVRAHLRDLKEPIDIVDVFRPSFSLPGHVEDILAMEPRPKVVWLQSGIENDDVAERLVASRSSTTTVTIRPKSLPCSGPRALESRRGSLPSFNPIATPAPAI